jgi:hypothetical protein
MIAMAAHLHPELLFSAFAVNVIVAACLHLEDLK